MTTEEVQICTEKCKELMEAGFIRKSNSEYAAATVVAARTDLTGKVLSKRMCGDYRGLNKVTVMKSLGYRWSMDIAGELPVTTEGRRYILLMVEDVSKWAEAKPLVHKTAEAVAETFEEMLVTWLGACGEVLTDQGMEFKRAFEELLKATGIRHPSTSCDGVTESDGLTERLVQTVKKGLRAYREEHKEDWDRKLCWVMAGYRFSKQASLRDVSPYYLLFGKEPVMPVGAPKLLLYVVTTGSAEKWVEVADARAAYLRPLLPAAVENLHVAQLRDIERYKQRQEAGGKGARAGRWTVKEVKQSRVIVLEDGKGKRVADHVTNVVRIRTEKEKARPSGLYLPSFSTNLVSGADLQDQGVDQFTPASQRVTHCTCARTGRHLATFTRRPGSSLYTLSTESPPVPASGQVAASSQVFAAASGSGPKSAPCSCCLLSHQTLLWHHRLGHPSLPRLRGMASRVLVYGLPRSLPPLAPGPAPTCVPCVEGRQRAAPHSSEFPRTEAPLQTLHMDVWGPARVRGQGHERYFLLVVDDYSRYTTVFPLRSKGDVTETFTLPASPQQNGIAECRIGMVMDVARTSMIHAAAPHFLWPFAVQYAAHQLNLQPRVSLPETSPTLRWTGKVGDASAFRGPASSGVSQVDAVEPVEVAVDSGAARGAEPVGAGSEDAESSGAETVGAGSGGTEFGGAEPWGAEPGGAEPGGAEPGGVAPGGTASTHVASRGASSRRELLSPQELREWFARRWSRAAGAGGSPVASGPGGARTSGTRAVGTGGAGAATGVGPAGASGAAGARATGGVGAGVRATGASGAAGAGAAGCVDTGVGPAGGTAGSAGGTGAAGPAGVGAVGAGGAASTGAATGGTGTVPVGTGGPARPRPYFVPLLEQVLGLPPSLGPAPPLACPPPVQSQSQLQPVSPLPAPSPYAGPTGGLAERREPASRPTSPVRTARASRRALRPCPPAVLDTHQMTLRPSTAPLRVPLPSSPASSLPALADPASDSLRAVSPTVARLLSTVVTDPSFESTAASALVDELVDFAARCRLDYAASLVAESASVCPPSVGGECALRTDILEDRQEEIQCFAAALPHLLAMDAEMASWKSTGTYVDKVPPPGANIVSGMYVDDLVFATADTAGLAHVKSELQKRHTCIDLGELRSYLGLQITQDRAQRTITLTQSHMVQQVLQRFDFTYSSDCYKRELVGCLMYLMTCTRPDLAYPLSILARYVAPGRHRPEQMAAAKRVLRYLCSTSGFGLVLGGRRPVVLTGHADASWADDQATQRSSQGYTFSLGSGSVSWRSTHSSSVLGSSCEAEIYAGAMAAQELRWLTYLLADLGEPPSSPPVLYVDNKAMLALCREHRLEHRTKHIALRYFLARELQQRGQLRLAYVASQANTADIFTKALPPGDHQHFCTML
ncbi:unnamed protein product, partial [Closterium sp. NIES-54]